MSSAGAEQYAHGRDGSETAMLPSATRASSVVCPKPGCQVTVEVDLVESHVSSCWAATTPASRKALLAAMNLGVGTTCQLSHGEMPMFWECDGCGRVTNATHKCPVIWDKRSRDEEENGAVNGPANSVQKKLRLDFVSAGLRDVTMADGGEETGKPSVHESGMSDRRVDGEMEVDTPEKRDQRVTRRAAGVAASVHEDGGARVTHTSGAVYEQEVAQRGGQAMTYRMTRSGAAKGVRGGKGRIEGRQAIAQDVTAVGAAFGEMKANGTMDRSGDGMMGDKETRARAVLAHTDGFVESAKTVEIVATATTLTKEVNTSGLRTATEDEKTAVGVAVRESAAEGMEDDRSSGGTGNNGACARMGPSMTDTVAVSGVTGTADELMAKTATTDDVPMATSLNTVTKIIRFKESCAAPPADPDADWMILEKRLQFGNNRKNCEEAGIRELPETTVLSDGDIRCNECRLAKARRICECKTAYYCCQLCQLRAFQKHNILARHGPGVEDDVLAPALLTWLQDNRIEGLYDREERTGIKTVEQIKEMSPKDWQTTGLSLLCAHEAAMVIHTLCSHESAKAKHTAGAQTQGSAQATAQAATGRDTCESVAQGGAQIGGATDLHAADASAQLKMAGSGGGVGQAGTRTGEKLVLNPAGAFKLSATTEWPGLVARAGIARVVAPDTSCRCPRCSGVFKCSAIMASHIKNGKKGCRGKYSKQDMVDLNASVSVTAHSRGAGVEDPAFVQCNDCELPFWTMRGYELHDCAVLGGCKPTRAAGTTTSPAGVQAIRAHAAAQRDAALGLPTDVEHRATAVNEMFIAHARGVLEQFRTGNSALHKVSLEEMVRLPVDTYVHKQLKTEAFACAKLLGAMILATPTVDDDALIRLLLVFPKFALAKGLGRGRKSHAKRNLQGFPNNISDADVRALQDFRPSPRQEDPEFKRRRRAERLAREGDLRRANATAFGSAPADMGDHTVLTQIQQKFPQCVGGDDLKLDHKMLPKPFVVDVDKVGEVLQRMDARSAPGISGFSTKFIKTFWEIPEFRLGVTKIVAFIANGLNAGSGIINRDSLAFKWLMAGRVIALKKSEGAVRPVCMLEAFYRIAARMAVEAAVPQTVLAPFQLGVGSKFGAEPMVHLARAALRDGLCVTSVDIVNAFGELDRRAMFEALRIHAPSLMRIAVAKYGCASDVWYNTANGDTGHILCSAGTEQGDPLASFLFSLTIKGPLEQVHSELNERQRISTTPVASYADDIQLNTETPELGVWAMERLEQLIQPIGLKVAKHKCFQICAGEAGVRRVVGGLIGADTAAQETLSAGVDDLCRRMEVVSTWDVQPAYLLLRNCMFAEMNFTARVHEPHVSLAAIARFTGTAHRAIARLVGATGGTLNEIQQLKAGMRRSDGGMGLPLPTLNHVGVTYAASLAQASAFWKERAIAVPRSFITSAAEVWLLRGAQNLYFASTTDLLAKTVDDMNGLQSRMMEREHVRLVAQLYRHLATQEGHPGNELRLRADEARGKLATAALADIPSEATPEFAGPTDDSLRAHMRFVLGMPQILNVQVPAACVCGTTLHVQPTLGEPHAGRVGAVQAGAHAPKLVDQHARACTASAGRFIEDCHNGCRDHLYAAAVADGRAASKEPYAAPGRSQARGDINIGPPGLLSGKNQDTSLPTMWDVSLVALSASDKDSYPKLPADIGELKTREQVASFRTFLAAHQAVSFAGLEARRREKDAHYRSVVPGGVRVFNWVISTNGGCDVATDNAIPKAGNNRRGRWFTRIRISNTLNRFNVLVFEKWCLATGVKERPVATGVKERPRQGVGGT